ncbi:MAG: hypothetical protein ABWY12_03190 [Burkholderiales bacterium]
MTVWDGLNHERGRLIRVVVADAEYAQRPLGGQRDLSPCRQLSVELR